MVFVVFPAAMAFYLPSVGPKDYKENDPIALEVNALDSTFTTLPYDYYNEQFHFCKPKSLKSPTLSLGSVLFGDRLYNSPFEIQMLKDTTCNVLCEEVIVTKDSAKFINDRIRDSYVNHWVIDGLPVAMSRKDKVTGKEFYHMGFNLGFKSTNNILYLNNHYQITIKYHKESGPKYRVVGASIWPFSVEDINKAKDCGFTPDLYPLHLKEEGETKVKYTYNIKWEESTITWGTRWDMYLNVLDVKIHWFSLLNSIFIVLFLSGMVAMILMRALHKDIARYNQIDDDAEDAAEDFGWKLVHGDVFRAPVRGTFLAVAVGSGSQLVLMISVTLVFAVLGFLSPSSRGSLPTALVVTYILFGSVAGYQSARFYKMFGGENWKKNVLLSAFFVPGVLILVLIIINFFLIAARSSAAIPFGTIFVLFLLWGLVSVPLCFAGAYFGFKKEKIEHPVRTNQIPRQIPEQPYYLRTFPSVFMGGILPFGAIFIELYFIMNSLWGHRVYYVFGFLFVVFSILIVTCAEVTMLMCYFNLCSEDYHWWWRSFFMSGTTAFYVFLYSIYYYYTALHIEDLTSSIVYFGWSVIISILIMIVTGTIGFYSCFMFVRKIYSTVKID